MPANKLDIEIFAAWNTYAVGMMSALEGCGMWKKTDSFQKFICETGIAAKFCVDRPCSPLPVTDYDWLNEHTQFMERIGVETVKFYCAPQDPLYGFVQQEAIHAAKNAIGDGIASVAWGIDTGEFGVIYGYDDKDKILLAKGIGSSGTNASQPILYSDFGKTFEYAPILYCEIPKSKHPVNKDYAFINFLSEYVLEMGRRSQDAERAYGISAYDMLISAVNEKKIDEFGFRYCIGIYHERKEAILGYLLERLKEIDDNLLLQLVDSFSETAALYKRLMFDILRQDTAGWDYLTLPISGDSYTKIEEVLSLIKASEKRSVTIAKILIFKMIYSGKYPNSIFTQYSIINTSFADGCIDNK